MSKSIYSRHSRSTFKFGMKTSRRIQQVEAYILIFLMLILALMPVVWLFSTALQTKDQIRISIPIQWLPNPLTFENFANGWAAQPWLLYLRNTMIITLGSLIGTVATTTITAYAFARLQFRGRKAMEYINIGVMLLPGQVTMISTFILFAKLGWVGTFKPLVVPSFFAMAPYWIFLMTLFFRSIPMELSEAARIDGANEFNIFLRIILPLTKPVLALMVAGHIVWAWNDLLGPLIYLKDDAHRTLILGLQTFIGARGNIGWGPLMAMSALFALPMMILFYFTQRYFVESFRMSGVKG